MRRTRRVLSWAAVVLLIVVGIALVSLALVGLPHLYRNAQVRNVIALEYFLYDAFGAQDLPRRYLDTLRSGGVRVAEFRPVRWYALDRASHRLHVRGVVVDGLVAYTGGFGFDDQWLGDGKRPQDWRETNVRFSGAAVGRLQAAFIASWAETTGELLTGERFLALEDDARAPAGAAACVSEAALVHSPALTGSTKAEPLVALSPPRCTPRPSSWTER